MSVLQYDPLPAGSTIQIERSAERLRLTIPPGQVPSEFLAAARRSAVLPAALYSGAIILGGFLFARIMLGTRRLDAALLAGAAAALIVLCAALFLLIWQCVYRLRRESLRNGYGQATLI